MIRKKSLLITGITGFVGGEMVKAFKNQYNIIGISRKTRKYEGLQCYSWDNISTIPECDIIIHLSGIAHELGAQSSIHNYMHGNYELTRSIFEYYKESTAEVFIYFSSVKAVADSLPDKILTETDNPSPSTPYGISKLKAEEYITKESQELNKSTYILRPSMIHGPGNKGNLNLLFSLVSKGYPIPLSAYNSSRTFTSIGNIIYVTELIIKGLIRPGVYNVCDTESIQTKELVDLIYNCLERKPRYYYVPKFIVKYLAKMGDYLKLPINTSRLEKMTENYLVSNKKLLFEMGHELPVRAAQGIKHTLSSLKSERDL